MAGFASGSNDQLDVFRVVVALAAVVKFGADHRGGMWRYFDTTGKSLTRYRYERSGAPVLILLSPRIFKGCYTARAAAAVLLLLGVLPRASAAAVAAWCLFEFTWDRKFNTLFLGFVSIPLVLTPGLADYLSLQSVLDASSAAAVVDSTTAHQHVAWQQVALIVFIFEVYWSSARYKLRSPQFMSGDVLQKVFEQMATLKDELPGGRREYFFPDWFTRRYALDEPAVVARRWRPAARGTVALEIALPVLLLFPVTWPVAAVLGVVLHSAFASLLPKRLVPFGLSMVGSYVLFLPPGVFASVQHTAAGWAG